MIDINRIFLDTSPIIYYLQSTEPYYSNMKKFWKDYIYCNYVTSVVTITEYLTYPYRQNDTKMINSFYSFIEDMEIEVKNIDKRIAEKAA